MAQQQQRPQTPAQSNVPPTPAEQVKRLETMLNGMTRDFEAALPAAAKARAGDFLRMALVDVPRSKNLLELAEKAPARIMVALMDIARLGLVPGSKLGEAWVVPFAVGKGDKRRPDCQAIIGYQGFLKLARNSGMIKSIAARAVFEGDTFDLRFGLHEDLVHVPSATVDRTDPNKVLGCYSVVHFRDGGHHIDYMSADEIIAISKRSPSYDRYEGTWSGPWSTDWIEMAKKTVIRRAAKQWPKSIEMAEAIALDERDEIVVEPSRATTTAIGHTPRQVFDVSGFEEEYPPEPEPVPVAAQPVAASKPAAATNWSKPSSVPVELSATERAEILRREREEQEREEAARDRARGD